MANTVTTRTYAKSEFTTAVGVPNMDILAVEVAELGLSLDPYEMVERGTDVVFSWSDLPVTADFTALDTAVADHPGGTFESATQESTIEAETLNATGAEQVDISHETGKLPPGKYTLSWTQEVRLSSISPNTGVEGSFYYTKNGGARYKAGRTTNTLAQYISMGSAVRLTVEAGDEYLFELANHKIGAGAVDCYADNLRIYLTPLAND